MYNGSMKGVYEMTFTVTERFANATFTYSIDFTDLDALADFGHNFGGHALTIDFEKMTIMINMSFTRIVNVKQYEKRLAEKVEYFTK